MAVTPMQNLTTWLPRMLLLFAIWGVAVFLWGTFGAWTHNQYTDSERRVAQVNVPAMRAWLEAVVSPLDRLAFDARIAEGIQLPAGVESLPVQRVLYEYGYLTHQTEIYIVDLNHKQVGRTAGASPLSSEVVDRLAKMDDAERMVMGMGSHTGQMMLIRKVKAPLPYRLVVMVPASLSALAGTMPDVKLPEKRTLQLVVPHATGWAGWLNGEQGFRTSDELTTAMTFGETSFMQRPLINILVPINDWPGVWLDLQSPDAVTGARILPQLLVGLWAVAMSILVLWNAGAPYRQKAVQTMRPVIDPLGKLVKPMNAMIHSISDAISARWNAPKADIPLLDGPGAFGKEDFAGGGWSRGKSGRMKLAQGKPMNLMQAAPEVDKKPRSRAEGHPMGPKHGAMSWPEAKPKKPMPVIQESNVDQEDMVAVVRDCLQKKRLRLLYQAIYRAGDNMPVMHEVYARLVRESGEIIPPNVFMPIVLKHKMALELDLVVLRRVVHDHFTSGASPMTPLALNISSTSLDGIAYLQEMTSQGPRVLQKISFEVQSQEMIRDSKALRLLKDLQKHGGNLAVDYFGGGVAMLDASKAMGFNYVKLNCSKFMQTSEGKTEVNGLCQHAKQLGLPIILEMVGDREAYQFAKSTGAEFLQGYALGMPQEGLSTAPLAPELEGMNNLAALPKE